MDKYTIYIICKSEDIFESKKKRSLKIKNNLKSIFKLENKY